MTRLPRPALLTALVASALIAVGCASTPEPEATATSVSSPSATAETKPTPTATSSTTPKKPTCETLVGSEVVDDFTAKGWTAREEPFVIGDVELEDGISCTWADYSGATANLLTFAWAPITDAETTKAQRALDSAGWIREKGDTGTYVTEDPATAMTTDAEGYGLTYLFGDGWVTFSDTRQGLMLIQRPGS